MKIESNIDVSKEMKYHLDHDISIAENVFRYGSSAWAALICEARQLYESGVVLEIDEDEYYTLERDIGELGNYKGKQVILESPEPIWDKPGFFEVFIQTDYGVTKIEFEDKGNNNGQH